MATAETMSPGDVELWQVEDFNRMCDEAGITSYVALFVAKRGDLARRAAENAGGLSPSKGAADAEPDKDPLPEDAYDEVMREWDPAPLVRWGIQTGNTTRLMRAVTGAHPSDVSDEEVERYPMSRITNGWASLTKASVEVMRLLLGFGSSIG